MKLTKELIDDTLDVVSKNRDAEAIKQDHLVILETDFYKEQWRVALKYSTIDPLTALMGAIVTSFNIGYRIGLELGHKEALKEMLEGK